MNARDRALLADDEPSGRHTVVTAGEPPLPSAPVDRVGELMDALKRSVEEARAARGRGEARPERRTG